MENKKIVALIKGSAYKELKEELPELFNNDSIKIELLEDHMFDYFLEFQKDIELKKETDHS